MPLYRCARFVGDAENQYDSRIRKAKQVLETAIVVLESWSANPDLRAQLMAIDPSEIAAEFEALEAQVISLLAVVGRQDTTPGARRDWHALRHDARRLSKLRAEIVLHDRIQQRSNEALNG